MALFVAGLTFVIEINVDETDIMLVVYCLKFSNNSCSIQSVFFFINKSCNIKQASSITMESNNALYYN